LEERNEIERQAIIALRHLADLVIFILDPTGTCGYPLEYQLSLLDEIKRLYPEAKMIVVENKADLLGDKGKRLRISALTKIGIEQLIVEIESSLADSPHRNVFSS